MQKLLVAAAGCLTLSGCATAYSITPIDTGSAKVTYNSGSSTTDLERLNGAVKITPIGIAENGRVNFAVAAFNKGSTASNFGSENFTASVSDQPIQVYSHAQLAKEAKTAAAWTTVAIALSGAASAYAANQNAYTTSNATLFTPTGGAYRYTSTTYDPTAAALGTAAATAATVGGIYSVRKELDETLDRLGGTILQTTTIQPNEAFGGQIVVGKPKQVAPYTMEVVTRWNDEVYTFRFNVAQLK